MTDNINEIPFEEEFEEEFEVEFEEELEPIVDPTQVITLRTSGGETRYIPADEPMTLAMVKNLSGLAFGAVSFYMNAAVIDDNTVIPVGSVITAVGNVKGGR
jgi:hypothetical protein